MDIEMFPTWLISSIKFRNQGAVDGNISKNRIMKLDEFLQHSNYILEQDRFMVTLGRRVQEHCRLCV